MLKLQNLNVWKQRIVLVVIPQEKVYKDLKKE